MDWDTIGKAFDMVSENLVARVDGPTWKVYRVGQIVRIDIEARDRD